MQTYIQTHTGTLRYTQVYFLDLTPFLLEITTSIDKKLQVDAHHTKSKIKLYLICMRPNMDMYWMKNVLLNITFFALPAIFFKYFGTGKIFCIIIFNWVIILCCPNYIINLWFII